MRFLKSIFILLLLFFIQSGIVYANQTEFLYLIKNSNAKNIKNIADFYSRQNNMPIVDSQEFHTNVKISSSANDFYSFVVQQNFDDTFFYFFSPVENKKICREILNRFKINGFKYSKMNIKEFNVQKYKDIIDIDKNLYSQNLPLNDETNFSQVSFQTSSNDIYDFSDEAQKKYENLEQNLKISSQSSFQPIMTIEKSDKNKKTLFPNDTIFSPDINQQTSNDKVLIGTVNTLNMPQGIIIPVILQSTINTASLEKNDSISALLQNDLYINGKLIAKQNSIVYGTAIQSDKAGGAYKNGSLKIVFEKILTTEGKELNINTEPIFYTKTDSNRNSKIAKNMAKSIAIGALISSLYSIGNTEHAVRNIAIGAGTGAITGGLYILNAAGEEIELKEGAVLNIKTVPYNY